ncbi:unnamed protein product [Acanthoscelides obtectus]|uniref:PiggyBac transposable element-derived protein domain-containing protein n=1 Tax=Acanthoscelides obtectus TaxID=200917 RepID=A0A9P0K112_ACAOB|nr:unnamed protein product [Acanthoscelides obtectus]CAK1627486.1 PiggyBac transposable element-derived protein 4 [Acanthoscelides obtectus]
MSQIQTELELTLLSRIMDMAGTSAEYSEDEVSDISCSDSNETFSSPSSSDSESDESDEIASNGQPLIQKQQSICKAVLGNGDKRFNFTGNPGLKVPPKAVHLYTPLECFMLFVDDSIIDLMVTETNRNANHVPSNSLIGRHSRMTKWSNTDNNEMKKFLGFLLWMDDSQNKDADRLFKIRGLLDKLNLRFQQMKEPDLYIAVDETMIPFQYLPEKRHKYGVKLFKICSRNAYTYKIEIHEGKSSSGKNLSEAVVLRLCENYLDCGRTVVTDNLYSSIELAEELVARRTDLIGTIRKNGKGFPKEVITAKLKKAEIVGKESNDVVVIKWKDQRDC